MRMGKLLLLVGAGIGYVLGSRAGRHRYEQIRGAAIRVKDNPRVRKTTHQAVDLAKSSATKAASVVRRKAPVAADKVAALAGAAVAKLRPGRAKAEPGP